jgi:hypothetical protein
VSASVTRGRERADQYTLELQRHGLESVQREVRWLNELITNERQITTASGSAPSVPTPTDSSPQIHPEKDN